MEERAGWRLILADGREAVAAVLVDAAGAWADIVAELAGLPPLGIAPLRRTIAQLRIVPAAPAALRTKGEPTAAGRRAMHGVPRGGPAR